MQVLQPCYGVYLLLKPAERNRTYLEFKYSSGGSWFEQPGDRGKRHLMEHCLVARTKTMSFQELKDYCFAQEIDLNAFTSNLTMSVVASGHKDDFASIFNLLIEFFLNPTFDQADLDREKEVVLREISEYKGDPKYVLHYDTMSQVFTPESLDNNQVLGLSEEVATTSLADFQRIHRQILLDSHLILKFSGGGFDIPEVQVRCLDKIKNSLPGAILSQTKTYPIGYLPKNIFQDFQNLPYVHPFGHEHAEVSVYIPCAVTLENLPVQAIFEQLYLRHGGILYDRLRDELGLVYGIAGTFRQTLQVLQIDLHCEIRHIKPILTEINATFSDFQANFKLDKFQQMKHKIRKQKDIAADSPKFFVDFAEKYLLQYGVVEDYENYSAKIEQATQAELQAVYEDIRQNLVNKKVVVVSQDSKIQTEDIFA